MTANVQVQFRECRRGETISIFDGIVDVDTMADIHSPCNHIDLGVFMFCDACSQGTYSLVNNVDEKTKCKYCGSNKEIETCSADQIKLKKGWL